MVPFLFDVRLVTAPLFVVVVVTLSLFPFSLFLYTPFNLSRYPQRMASFNNNSNSTKSFLTSLITNASLLAIEVSAFIILKQRLGRIYSPRTFLPPPDKRATPLSGSWWKWLPQTILTPSKDVIHKNGLDAYMFLRFMRVLAKVFAVYTLVTFLVIVPVDTVGLETTTGNVIERISWINITGNPPEKTQPRFAAHVVVVYLLTFYVFHTIRSEMSSFVRLRHEYLLTPPHSTLAQARTVLITSVPHELGTEKAVRVFGSFVPGGIDRVWIYRDTRTLNTLFERREEACSLLEKAITDLLKSAVQAYRKKQKKLKGDLERMSIHQGGLELLDELVPQAKRPKHRPGFLGRFGAKVDTIEWCAEEVGKLNEEIDVARRGVRQGESKFLGSIFIRTTLPIGAHILAQCVSWHEPLKMVDKWMEVNSKDIVWPNLDDNALEMRGRALTSWVLNIGLIIGLSFPVIFIGTMSNVDDLCDQVKQLRWVCEAPSPIPGLVQGVLPPVLLAALFAVLPYILRGLAWYENIPRYSLISTSVYHRFYLFLLIHGFLIVTLTSGITKAIEDIIRRPTDTVQSLARQLPGASVFFLTYIITQGLAGAGIALAQLIPMIIHFIKKWFLGRTPRQAYGVTFMMPAAEFDVILPRMSLLATIGFAYSVLNPLINPLACVSFGMFYIAYKLLFVQVMDQPDAAETAGLYFPMAVSNLCAFLSLFLTPRPPSPSQALTNAKTVVGLYIQQICLAALFFARASHPSARVAALVQGALMLVLTG
ncbi:phosphate metabolism protein 7 [Paramarasmius palmivorus]|uniref:Phosphate metabolism protein 7 n=1 Tax=Paramarasmius palmivorus TaxID=297713 RepID=A0AAW0CGE1_9AGAR